MRICHDKKQGEKIPASVSEEELNSLQKALREQEIYLQAYQKDNERLTGELKAAQVPFFFLQREIIFFIKLKNKVCHL
jgi:hypothetical protein